MELFLKLNKIIDKVAVKVLPFYARYFGIEYKLPKLDMLAIGDLSFGEFDKIQAFNIMNRLASFSTFKENEKPYLSII